LKTLQNKNPQTRGFFVFYKAIELPVGKVDRALLFFILLSVDVCKLLKFFDNKKIFCRTGGIKWKLKFLKIRY